MAIGPTIFFNQALKKLNEDVFLATDAFRMVLTTNAQVLTAAFDGASLDCRYADLTAELPTGSGYTAGGMALAGETLTRAVNVVTFTSAPVVWVLTAALSAKFFVIYDDTTPNKDLLMFCDLDTLITAITVGLGMVQFSPPAAGWGRWTQ